MAAGGVYYRGALSEVDQQQPELEAPDAEWAAYDPWEAIEVAWDGRAGGSAGGLPAPCPSALCFAEPAATTLTLS